jgi:PAS domain S-box-containing protein
MQAISPTDRGATASSRRLRDWVPALSIRVKLPLLASSLLLAVTFTYGSFAYRAVRRAALTAATDRLVTVADQLSASLQVSGQQLATGLRTIAADPPVRMALRSSGARVRADAVVALRRWASQSPQIGGFELWDSAGRRVLRVAGTGPPVAAEPEPGLLERAAGPDSGGVGAFRADGDSVLYPVLVPVRDQGARLGALLEWRRVSSSARARAVTNAVIGSSATVYVGNVAGDVWTNLSQAVPPPPVPVSRARAVLEYERPGTGAVFAAARPIVGPPWILLVEFPRAVVLAPAQALFRQLALAALLILAVGLVAAWLLSRNITDPLRRLTGAAQAVAGGDHTRSLRLERRDELGRLAEAFDTMAERVWQSRERLEEEVRQRAASEERFRLLLDSTAEGIFGLDEQAICTFCNSAALQLLGYESPADLVGKQLHPVLHHTRPSGKPYPITECRIIQSLKQGRDVHVDDEVFWRADGTSFPVEYWSYPLRHGATVLGAVVTFLDVTERQRAETAVRASEATYRSLVEDSPYAILRSAPDGRLLAINPAMVEMLGYASEAELLTKHLARDVHADATEHTRFVDAVVGASHATAEVVWRRKDGRTIIVNESGRAIRDSQGRLESVNAVAEDITERRRLEHQLREGQKMEAIGQLAAGVAHDFNNLLTAILGAAELLIETLPVGHPGREETEEISKSALRAADLTRQLLAFARQQVLAPRVLVLNDIVAGMDKLLRRLIGENIELRTVLAPGLGTVRADRGQLEQVIINLAVNARDAMPEGGKLTLETADADLDASYVATRPDLKPGAYVLLAVTDTGIGMDAETKARLFEPFFTTKPKGKGTGLGLATVYGIIHQSGGHIWVYSEPGQGTTFKVYLPRIREGAEAARPAPVSVGSLDGTETVLVVEDQEEVGRITRRILKARGYTVIAASNGHEALRVAEQHPTAIDLLITDVVMPGMSGREVGLLLGATRPTMRVLYLSGYTDESIVHHGVLEAGISFLQKPFTPDALARKVREVLDGAPTGRPSGSGPASPPGGR